MDRNKNHIVILVNQFHDLLCGIAIRDTYQSGKTPYSVIGMHHIITGSKLIEFL